MSNTQVKSWQLLFNKDPYTAIEIAFAKHIPNKVASPATFYQSSHLSYKAYMTGVPCPWQPVVGIKRSKSTAINSVKDAKME